MVLSLVMLITAAVIPSQAVTKGDSVNTAQEVPADATPTYTTAQFLDTLNVINKFTGIITGRAFIPTTEIKLTVDETITGYCDTVLESSGLDIVGLLGAFKNMNYPIEHPS